MGSRSRKEAETGDADRHADGRPTPFTSEPHPQEHARYENRHDGKDETCDAGDVHEESEEEPVGVFRCLIRERGRDPGGEEQRDETAFDEPERGSVVTRDAWERMRFSVGCPNTVDEKIAVTVEARGARCFESPVCVLHDRFFDVEGPPLNTAGREVVRTRLLPSG